MEQIVNVIKGTLVIALLLCVTACATHLPIAPVGHGFDPLRANPHVLFRDLTKPSHHQAYQKGGVS